MSQCQSVVAKCCRVLHLDAGPPEKPSMTLDLVLPRLTPCATSSADPVRLRTLAESVPRLNLLRKLARKQSLQPEARVS